MELLNIHGHLGKEVTFNCTGWNIWFHRTNNYVKYLCDRPCTRKEHVILKVPIGETTRKDRIQLTNKGEGLLVKFENLQKSDSKKYLCALEKSFRDAFIEVNVIVTEGKFTLCTFHF